MKVFAREFKPVYGGDYSLNVRFESQDQEKLFGMGQYQQANLDLKGCLLELAQRNSQVSIPFVLSSLGYGFLWNNPAIGRATFGNNYTEWSAQVTEQMDYWITVDSTPAEILRSYTAAVGRTPLIPPTLLGLWQSKLRYRTQEEVLTVAREYHRRGIPLDVIVIDFFHWVRQGDWSFDPQYWPDPRAMVDELRGMGTRCMVSIWPTVDKNSVHFSAMKERGLLVRTERGSSQTFDFLGDTQIYDATNPEAREFLWNTVKKNYYDFGIDLFWLDEAEPEFIAYDYDHYRYHLGPTIRIGNVYPRAHSQAFYDGMVREGRTDFLNLVRCAWVGSQKYASLVWSGDILSSFESFRDQFAAGLNMGIAGIPLWVSDTGGFFGNVEDELFEELMIRWFQWAAFCPILRMHGDRSPHTDAPLDESTIGGGFCFTGLPNEIWSFGDRAYRIMKRYVELRLGLKPYIASLVKDAHETGSPMMRTMFYEFPEDQKCWDLDDQYMFGSRLLVAPVMFSGLSERRVYLPAGKWRNIEDQVVYDGNQEVIASAPLEFIPVFERMQ